MNARIDIAERCGRYVSSRHMARALRIEVVRLVECGCTVTISFREVVSISDSFADGLLGKLAAERGRRWLETNLRIEGLGQDDQRDVDAVIAYRAQQIPQGASSVLGSA